MNEQYLQDLYEWIKNNDSSYEGRYNYEQFKQQMRDKNYATKMHGWIGGLDDTFSERRPLDNFLKEVGSFKTSAEVTAPVKKKFALESSSEDGLLASKKSIKPISDMPTLDQPGVMESVKKDLKNAPKNDTERYFKQQQKELKESLDVIKETKARQIEEKNKELYQQKEADKANLGLRTRKDFTSTLNSVVNSNLTSKTEENAINDLRKNFEKYGISFEESGFGTDKIIARTVDGKKSIEIDFDNWTTGGNVEAANKLKDFISKNASEITRAQSGDFLDNSLKAQKLRSIGRLNSDGSTSTVKFTSFEEDGKFKVIPTLFPKDPNNYSTNPNSWTELQFKDALKLARERGEVFEFKTDKEAKQFAKGAWKDVNAIDAEADKFYKQKGLDYMSNKKTYEEYVKVRDMVDFIEERRNDRTIDSDERAQKYSQLLVNGRFRSDVDKLLEKYKTQEEQLRSQVFDAGFVSDGKIQKTREEFDVYLDKRQNKVAQEAAKLNAKAKAQVQDAEVKSVDMFGLSVKDLMNYKPKNEQEAIEKNNIVKLYEDSKLTQNFAAKKYENAKTYFDAKVNKQIKGEYEDNWSAFSSSVSDAYKNGKAAEQILAFTLGIKDVDSKTDKAEAARIIVENLTNQSENSSRAMARWQQASGFSEGLDAFLDNPFELMTTMAATSLSQILPYGMKIVPSTTAAGASTGAVTGLLGGPFAEVTVPGGALAGGIQGFRGGMAATSLAMEYTNSVLDVMKEKGYDITDPNQVEQALSQEEIWKEGGERGLKRGIPISVVDYLSAGLAGKVFKPASAIASTGTKVATQVAERAVFDPLAEATGEIAAQITAGQEIDWKEISAEAMGGLGNNSSNMAINTYRTVKNNTDINIANNLTDVKFLGTESASDEKISSWANNMQQLGKIDADVNQRIQENVGLRREAREALSVGTNENTLKPSVLARTMELMSAKEELSSSVNRRELYSDKIKAINEELKVIADTKELAPEEKSIDLNTTLGTTKQGVSQYMIDGIRYTKEQFLEKTKNMSARRMLRSSISVNNDEEIGNELKQIVDEKLKAELSTEELTNLLNEEEDAIQIESTTEIPVQSETGVSEEVEGRTPEAKPEVVTEQVTEEEVKDFDLNLPENKDNIVVSESEDGFTLVDSETNNPIEVLNENAGQESVGLSKPYATEVEAQTRLEELKAEPEVLAEQVAEETQAEVTVPQTIIEEQAPVEEVAVVEEAPVVETQQLNEQDLPGYDRTMSEVEGIVEKSKKRKVSESKIFDNVMNYVTGSKIYEDATDVQREALVRDIRKRFGLKEKAAPSVNKLLGKIKDITKVTLNEKTALKKQIRDVARGARDAVKSWKLASQQLGKEIKELKASGKITANQAANIISAFSKVNVFSGKSVDRFTNYMTKVFENADYAAKIKEAKTLRSNIKKLSKNKDKNANLRVVAAKFVKIDPSLVEDIDMYNEMASKIKEAITGSTIRGQKVKFAETTNIQEAVNYTSDTLKEQEQKIREEMIAELQDLMGVDASEFTAEEMLALLEPESKTDEYNEGIVRATIKRAFDIYSTMINQSIKSGKDVFTDEDVEYTKSQKDIIKRFMEMDTDKMNVKDSLAAVDSLMNFLTNQSTAKMEAVLAKYTGQQNAAKIRRENIFAVPLKKLGFKGFGRFLGEQTTNLNILFEKMFVGFNRSGKVKEAMGLTDLINGKAKAQRELNTIVANYVSEFYNKEANNQKFNTLFNNIERGMTSFMSRNIIGTEAEMQAEFNRRKKLIEESIEVLSVGNDQERKKGLEYQKVYDKILDGSTNIQEVQSKVDPTNLKAVDFWIKEWDNKFDELSDTALNIYNKVLDKDLNYTPDRFTRTDYDGSSVDLANTASAFITNTNGNLYKKETGVLMEATRPNSLPKNEDTNEAESYVDLSFDNNNSNSMYDALVDINTAAPIRQVESFMNTADFRKIFGEDADLIKGKKGNIGRIQQYIQNIRNKNPYSNDEFSKTMRSLNKIATLGVSQALAGPTQPLKQVIPVALNTLINTKGNIDFSAMSNKDFMSWLNDSGYAIANRGVESQADIDSINKLIEQAAESKGAKFVKLIEDANKKWLKLFLVKSDVWVAISSWKSYYEQSLRDQGENTKDIDYSSHEINKEAANYAQRMVDRQQNISDTDMSGTMFSNKNPYAQTMVKIFMPFASFRMNQGSRLGSDLRVLSNWSVSTAEDKKIAARSLAGYAVEMATFRTISAAIAIQIASMTASLMGRGDEEEDKKKRREDLEKGALTSAITDIFSPIPVLDKLIQNKASDVLSGVQDVLGISEEEKAKIYNSKKENFIDGLGTFGIALKRGNEIWDLLSLSVTGEYEDDFGKKKKISEDNRKALSDLVGPVLLSNLTGFASPEVSGVSRNAMRIAKKKYLTDDEKLIKEEKASQKEENLSQKERALKQVMDKYPSTDVREAAKDLLNDLNAETKEDKDLLKEERALERENKKALLVDPRTGTTYDNESELKRYNPILWKKNFGPYSEWSKTHKAEQRAKKAMNKEIRKEEDKEYRYFKKSSKTKKNRDGSVKKSYSYKRTSSSDGTSSSTYNYSRTNADGSSTTIRRSKTKPN